LGKRIPGENGFQGFSPSDRTRREFTRPGPCVCIQQRRKKNGRATRAGPRCWTCRVDGLARRVRSPLCPVAPHHGRRPLRRRLSGNPAANAAANPVFVSSARKRGHGAWHRTGIFSRAVQVQVGSLLFRNTMWISA
jgi:hypothetical protein